MAEKGQMAPKRQTAESLETFTISRVAQQHHHENTVLGVFMSTMCPLPERHCDEIVQTKFTPVRAGTVRIHDGRCIRVVYLQRTLGDV